MLDLLTVVATLVKVDGNTLDVKRGRFTEIYVKIDLNKPLIGKIWIKGHCHKVEYEELHMICIDCWCYGHLDRDCKSFIDASSFTPDVSSSPCEWALYGEWLMV